MRIFAVVLTIALVLLQNRLWFSEQGQREVSRLRAQIEMQKTANLTQVERNRQLAAEVSDLKTGLRALEERARSELGMVGSSETFYQVVTPATLPPSAAPTTRSVRAE